MRKPRRWRGLPCELPCAWGLSSLPLISLASGFHETRPIRGSLRKDHTVRIPFARLLCGHLTGLLVLGHAASALAQAPQPLVPATETPETPEADSLAKYVPGDNLIFYMEFQGTTAHSPAWERSAASSILTDTKTGAMLTSILTQIAEGGLRNVPDRKLTGADVSELVTHALQSGFVIAAFGNSENGHGVFAVRNAFDKEIRPAFGRFLATSGMAKPGMKTIKKAGRTLVLNPDNPKGAWWIENGTDLVITADHATILDVLDDKKPNASKNPHRTELLQLESGFEPLLIAFANIPENTNVPQLEQAGLSGVRKLDLRWGPEGQRLKSVIRVQAPAPRKGLLALMDQPTFTLDTIPPMPEGTKEFSAFSLDLDRAYSQLKNIAALAPGGQGVEAFNSLEELVQTELKKDLQDDFFSQIGPRIVYYATSEKPTGIGAMASALNPLAGFQIPQFVVMAEVKDSKKFIVTLNETMSYVNEKLSESEDDDSNKNAPGGQNKSKPRPAQFRMLSPQPLTYMLSLPSNLSAVITAKPTIILGKNHLIIGATPDLARAALALEGKTEGLWTPESDQSQGALDGLPETLLMVQVSDPRDTLPDDLASLPDTFQSFITGLAAASRPPQPMNNGGFPGAGQPGSFPGAGQPGSFPGAGQPGSFPGAGQPGSFPGRRPSPEPHPPSADSPATRTSPEAPGTCPRLRPRPSQTCESRSRPTSDPSPPKSAPTSSPAASPWRSTRTASPSSSASRSPTSAASPRAWLSELLSACPPSRPPVMPLVGTPPEPQEPPALPAPNPDSPAHQAPEPVSQACQDPEPYREFPQRLPGRRIAFKPPRRARLPASLTSRDRTTARTVAVG